jgi:mycofactocin precursor
LTLTARSVINCEDQSADDEEVLLMSNDLMNIGLISNDGPVTSDPDQVIDDAASTDVEELLVEEVSIDGMCGVY